MLSEELLKKVKQIEITTRKRVDDVMTGQYRSHFKGHGVQFSEHRLYVPGDDVRHIDWKVSARSRDPLLKKYEEERELVTLLVVDVSGSGGFGSQAKLKSEVAAEIGGMLSYAASFSGDKVGVILFSGKIQKILPPKKGRQHVLRVIKEILTAEPAYKGTDLEGALESAARVMKHRGIAFVLSDFLAQDYEIQLKRFARKNDVVAISISDVRESDVPPLGPMLLVDPESGEERLVDTSSYVFQKWLKEFQVSRETDFKTAIKQGKLDHLSIQTQDDYAEAVVRFFRMRALKKSK